MRDVLRINNTVFVPTNAFLQDAGLAATYAQIRHVVMCEATSLKVAQAGRAIVFPSLRITEGPDDAMAGTRITIRAQTVHSDRAYTEAVMKTKGERPW